MQSGRKIGLILGVIALVVVLGFVVHNYFQVAAEHRELNDRLDVARGRVPVLINQEKDVQRELEAAETQLNSSLRKFSAALESVEYDDDLCKTARECGVQITSITASPPGERKEGAITYYVSAFSIGVSGDVRSILEFVHALRTAPNFQLPWSAQIKTVNVDFRGGTATITFDVYGYKR